MSSIDPAYLVAALVPLAFVTLGLLRAPAVYLLGIHIVSRVVLDSASEVTYAEFAGGLSLMQLYSVAFIGVAGLYLAWHRGPTWHAYTLPLLGIASVLVLSSLVNGTWMGLVTALLRWGYLWVLVALTGRALHEGSERGVMLAIFIAGAYAFLNQMYSVAAGTPKWGAGQWSYIGTYAHESDLSFLFILLVPAALYFLTDGRGILPRVLGAAALGATAIGMYLAAYRSLWVALAGYLGLYLWNRYLRGNITSRTVWLAASIAGISLLTTTLGPVIAGKMADLGVFIANPGRYLDFSGHADSVSLMSGRIDLINAYMGIFLNSGVHVWIAGIGPERGSSEVGLYAHNEYLSALVETGILGVLALVWLLARSARQSLSLATSRFAGAQVSAPFFMVVVIAALGTMPFRDMRGMLAIGLMMALVAHYVGLRQRGRQRVGTAVPDNTVLDNTGPDTPRPTPALLGRPGPQVLT